VTTSSWCWAGGRIEINKEAKLIINLTPFCPIDLQRKERKIWTSRTDHWIYPPYFWVNIPIPKKGCPLGGVQ
jgi:hypothetical protein